MGGAYDYGSGGETREKSQHRLGLAGVIWRIFSSQGQTWQNIFEYSRCKCCEGMDKGLGGQVEAVSEVSVQVKQSCFAISTSKG